jgi:diguanylate cyclase (GGDEF)-like protein/PAS domain S-box-containing protein
MPSAHHPPSAQATLDAIGDAIITTDASGAVTYLNRAAERMTAWPAADAVGTPIDTVLHLVDPTTRRDLPSPLRLAMRADETVALPPECLLISRDGREMAVEDSTAPVHDEDGAVRGAVIVFRHVGPALALARAMAHAALHDPLTGLPNRVLLLDRLATALASARRRRALLAVGFLDIDGFKGINDRTGHVDGDRLLQALAARLRTSLRVSDTVGRYGGDEFVVVLPELATRADLGTIAATMLGATTGVYTVGGRELHVTVSLGLALSPDNAGDVAALIARADEAMYDAKACGPGRFAIAAGDELPLLVPKSTDAGDTTP